jgi:hypothetical protein
MKKILSSVRGHRKLLWCGPCFDHASFVQILHINKC